jgi:hypothetical protein
MATSDTAVSAAGATVSSSSSASATMTASAGAAAITPILPSSSTKKLIPIAGVLKGKKGRAGISDEVVGEGYSPRGSAAATEKGREVAFTKFQAFMVHAYGITKNWKVVLDESTACGTEIFGLFMRWCATIASKTSKTSISLNTLMPKTIMQYVSAVYNWVKEKWPSNAWVIMSETKGHVQGVATWRTQMYRAMCSELEETFKNSGDKVR